MCCFIDEVACSTPELYQYQVETYNLRTIWGSSHRSLGYGFSEDRLDILRDILVNDTPVVLSVTVIYSRDVCVSFYVNILDDSGVVDDSVSSWVTSEVEEFITSITSDFDYDFECMSQQLIAGINQLIGHTTNNSHKVYGGYIISTDPEERSRY